MSPGQGRYALIGHHEKIGIAPIPPMMRPEPSHCIFSFASPQESQLPVHALSSAAPAARVTTAPRVLCVFLRANDTCETERQLSWKRPRIRSHEPDRLERRRRVERRRES
eukprot:31198-Pelagococcus_subviridis.AAC.72